MANTAPHPLTPHRLLTPTVPRSAHSQLITTYASLHQLTLLAGYNDGLYPPTFMVMSSDKLSGIHFVTDYFYMFDVANQLHRHAFQWRTLINKHGPSYQHMYCVDWDKVCDEVLENLELAWLEQVIHSLGD